MCCAVHSLIRFLYARSSLTLPRPIPEIKQLKVSLNDNERIITCLRVCIHVTKNIFNLFGSSTKNKIPLPRFSSSTKNKIPLSRFCSSTKNKIPLPRFCSRGAELAYFVFFRRSATRLLRFYCKLLWLMFRFSSKVIYTRFQTLVPCVKQHRCKNIIIWFFDPQVHTLTLANKRPAVSRHINHMSHRHLPYRLVFQFQCIR